MMELDTNRNSYVEFLDWSAKFISLEALWHYNTPESIERKATALAKACEAYIQWKRFEVAELMEYNIQQLKVGREFKNDIKQIETLSSLYSKNPIKD